MIEYLALHFLDFSVFIDAGTTYKTKFFFAFMLFNSLIVLALYVFMRFIRRYKHYRKREKRAKKEMGLNTFSRQPSNIGIFGGDDLGAVRSLAGYNDTTGNNTMSLINPSINERYTAVLPLSRFFSSQEGAQQVEQELSSPQR